MTDIHVIAFWLREAFKDLVVALLVVCIFRMLCITAYFLRTNYRKTMINIGWVALSILFVAAVLVSIFF